jgi:tetratricopeptide (TPR) repeat protein
LGRQFDAMSLLEDLYRDSETSGDVATRVVSLVQMFLVEYGEHDPKARATMLRRFVANDPQYVAARVALAQQEFPNGDLGSALQELQLCLQASPQDVECRQYLLEYGLHVAGAEPRSLEPLLDGWPAERRGFQYYRLLGELRLRQERLDDAISAFRDANKIRPDQIGVRHQHGMALMRQGRETEANEELRRTEELRGPLEYERVKRIFDSIPTHIEMGRVGSADAPMLRRLGSFYEEIGRLDLAQRWLREADRLKSGRR